MTPRYVPRAFHAAPAPLALLCRLRPDGGGAMASGAAGDVTATGDGSGGCEIAIVVGRDGAHVEGGARWRHAEQHAEYVAMYGTPPQGAPPCSLPPPCLLRCSRGALAAMLRGDLDPISAAMADDDVTTDSLAQLLAFKQARG